MALIALNLREARLERAAASAAIIAVSGNDPTAGVNASCDYTLSPSVIVLRAHYDCVVRECDQAFARVEITHVVRGGWRYEIVGRIPAGVVQRSDSTFPAIQATPEPEPGGCPY